MLLVFDVAGDVRPEAVTVYGAEGSAGVRVEF
jgi:hypothetical protein